MKQIYRNIGKLFSANVIAQVIGLLVYPLLTRIYLPEDFGLLNLFLSIAGVLVIPATMQYQHAIPLPAEEKQAVACFQGGILLLGACVAFLLLCLPFANEFAGLFKAPALADILWMLPVLVASMSLWQLLSNWYIRRKGFDRTAAYQLNQNILSAAGKYTLGKTGVGFGLVYGAVSASVIAVIASIAISWKKHMLPLLRFDWNEVKHTMKQYGFFPKYQTPRALANLLNSSMAVWFISSCFGMEATGYWGMAFLLALTPISVITESLYQVFLQDTTARHNNHQPVITAYRRYIVWASVILIPSFIGLYFCLPWMVGFLLGDGWQETAEMIRLLLPWFLVLVLNAPWNFVPNMYGKQKTAFGIELLYLALRLIVIGIGVYTRNLTVLLLGYSLTGVIIMVILNLWYGKLLAGPQAA